MVCLCQKGGAAKYGVNMKKILITGTGGFVGRNLAEYLPGRGAEVHAFTHHNLDLLDATAVAEKLASIKPEIVIHCASIGGTRKTAYDQQVGDVAAMNLRMFFNLERALPPVPACCRWAAEGNMISAFTVPR